MWVHANGIEQDIHSDFKEAIFPGAACLIRTVFEEYEDFPVSTWKEEVMNDDTRMGYHEWADCQEAVRDEKEYDEEQAQLQKEN